MLNECWNLKSSTVIQILNTSAIFMFFLDLYLYLSSLIWGIFNHFGSHIGYKMSQRMHVHS